MKCFFCLWIEHIYSRKKRNFTEIEVYTVKRGYQVYENWEDNETSQIVEER